MTVAGELKQNKKKKKQSRKMTARRQVTQPNH